MIRMPQNIEEAARIVAEAGNRLYVTGAFLSSMFTSGLLARPHLVVVGKSRVTIEGDAKVDSYPTLADVPPDTAMMDVLNPTANVVIGRNYEVTLPVQVDGKTENVTLPHRLTTSELTDRLQEKFPAAKRFGIYEKVIVVTPKVKTFTFNYSVNSRPLIKASTPTYSDVDIIAASGAETGDFLHAERSDTGKTLYTGWVGGHVKWYVEDASGKVFMALLKEGGLETVYDIAAIAGIRPGETFKIWTAWDTGARRFGSVRIMPGSVEYDVTVNVSSERHTFRYSADSTDPRTVRDTLYKSMGIDTRHANMLRVRRVGIDTEWSTL